jgi:5-methylcytosine-specific restriction endonuclease McrA
MSYLVTKIIKGIPYQYQVRSERHGNKVVQIFEKYIGRNEQEQPIANKNEETYRQIIYKRDKGLCWICRELVPFEEYELGHLVDRCNGGIYDYDNIVVMHKLCNSQKPKHKTIEEHITWLLKTRCFSCQ